MLGETAWDALLALFIADRHESLSVGTLIEAFDVPESSLVRWIAYLQAEKLVSSSAEAAVRQRTISLSEKGRSTMERYLGEILRSLAN
jgi:DNA-binding MarR family transcriptional regulator